MRKVQNRLLLQQRMSVIGLEEPQKYVRRNKINGSFSTKHANMDASLPTEFQKPVLCIAALFCKIEGVERGDPSPVSTHLKDNTDLRRDVFYVSAMCMQSALNPADRIMVARRDPTTNEILNFAIQQDEYAVVFVTCVATRCVYYCAFYKGMLHSVLFPAVDSVFGTGTIPSEWWVEGEKIPGNPNATSPILVAKPTPVDEQSEKCVVSLEKIKPLSVQCERCRKRMNPKSLEQWLKTAPESFCPHCRTPVYRKLRMEPRRSKRLLKK